MKYQHQEAFALLLYRDESAGTEEWLWNSRDGVVPFVIRAAQGDGEMQHVDWFRDVTAPFYIPPVGSRVFVDLTEQRARILAARYVEQHAAAMAAHPAFAGKSREEMLEDRLRQLMEEVRNQAPDILLVNDAMRRDFSARAPVPVHPWAGRRFA